MVDYMRYDSDWITTDTGEDFIVDGEDVFTTDGTYVGWLDCDELVKEDGDISLVF